METTSQILILEEKPEAAQGIQGLLSSSAVTDVAVASWSEALRLLRNNRFYAVVCDLDNMPPDGRKVLAAIHREAPNIASIVITDTADPALMAECTAAGLRGP